MEILVAVLVILGLFLGLQMMVRLRGRAHRGKPVPELTGKLGLALKKADKALLYFYSPTCSACRTQERYLPQVQQKFPNIHKINVQKDSEIARKFGVMGTPTTVVVENGLIKDYFVGVATPNKILKSLNHN